MNYPEFLVIEPLASPPNVSLAVPGSKSLTNRALILAALAAGTSTIRAALFSDDTAVMSDSLRKLGIPVTENPASESFVVQGQGGRLPNAEADLYVGNSGTSVRFLTALCALGQGSYRLDGVPRMRQRPQQDLLDALNALGVSVRSELDTGCPPLVVEAAEGLRGGEAELSASASSQFLTALLMVAPYAKSDVTIRILGELRPFYVDITRRMMQEWGVTTESQDNALFTICSGQRYSAQASYTVEPDASSASYFFAAAAVTGGTVRVESLGHDALQGDVRFATEVLARMGCHVEVIDGGISVTGPRDGQLLGVDLDMSAISDTSMTLAAIAPFASTPTTVRNIAHSRLQECDRISAVCTELQKLGVSVAEHSDGFTIYPVDSIRPATIETYGDHRVAMSFALIGLRAPGVTISDPGCVAKTFPDYWQRLKLLG